MLKKQYSSNIGHLINLQEERESSKRLVRLNKTALARPQETRALLATFFNIPQQRVKAMRIVGPYT